MWHAKNVPLLFAMVIHETVDPLYLIITCIGMHA